MAYIINCTTILNTHTIKFNPKVVGIEILKCLNRFKVIDMILGDLSYFKETKFIFVFYKRTTL